MYVDLIPHEVFFTSFGILCHVKCAVCMSGYR